MNAKKVLHVGCGPRHPEALHPVFRQPPWQEVRLDINPAVKPDIVDNITNMQGVADESVDAVWSCHNLEHLFANEVPIALGEFFRVLRNNGFVLIRLPDIQAVAREVARGNLEDILYESPAGSISAIDVLWGHRLSIASGNHFMAHKTGFTRKTLRQKMLEAGFGEVQIECHGLDLMGTAYKNSGAAASQTSFARQSESDSEATEQYSVQGHFPQNQEQVENAQMDCRKECPFNPQLAESWYNEGNSFHGRGDYESAVACYKKALKSQPDLVEVHYNLGNTYLDQKNYPKALSSYCKALALKPDYMDAHYNSAIAYFEQGLLDDALASYQKASELDSKRAATWYNMGIIFQQKEHLDRAIDCYQTAVDLKPDFVQAYNNLANVLEERNRASEAVSCYQKALELKPDYADAWYNLGSTLHGMGNYEQAQTCYQKALAIQPGYFKAGNNLAKLNQDMLQTDAALQWYKKSIELKPDYAEAHFNLSTAFLLTGDFLPGWREYEWRFKRREWKRTYPYRYAIPRWNGQSFVGKRLYVHSEQGLGDMLQFARYLPMVKARGGTVIFATAKPMMRLFRDLDGVDELIDVSQKAQFESDDYYIPLLSLPGGLSDNPGIHSGPDSLPFCR